MKLNIEKEYKILVTQEQFESLLEQFPQAVFKKQINTYYDTQNFSIRKAKGAMRIRELPDQFLFTLKLHTKHGVEEYEMPVTENHTAVFQHPEIRQLLDRLSIREPIKKITTLTTYRALIDTGNAEICFDYNEYHGHKDFEIEYEYKKDHDGFRVFQELLAKVGLSYHKNCTSKIQRALQTMEQ